MFGHIPDLTLDHILDLLFWHLLEFLFGHIGCSSNYVWRFLRLLLFLPFLFWLWHALSDAKPSAADLPLTRPAHQQPA